jgi:3-oxoacyl-[acyl-carrier-protein] synthase II
MLKKARKIAITGIGMINSLGCSAMECWDGMLHGRSGIARIQRMDVSDCITQIGGELVDGYYDLEKKTFSRRLQKQTVTTTRLGLLCAQEAIKDSGFSVEGRDPYACAVITGTGQTSFQETLKAIGEPGRFAVIQQMANALSGWISIEYGIKGPSYNLATACASGAFAIAAAYRHIATGAGEAVVVVGVDAMLSTETLKAFNQLGALSERNDEPETASRPFDMTRDGFVLANGGAALVLESEETARRRSARVYATVSGTGLCSEAYNIVAPDPSGAAMSRAMSIAMEDAGIVPEQVGYISAHGTSTPHNDSAETAAIKTAFGEQARHISISSQKSMTGHTIGGAGAIECVTTALCLSHGVITPTINYHAPDPKCDLDYVPNVAREAKNLNVALSNSFGFGGHNSTIVLEKVA